MRSNQICGMSTIQTFKKQISDCKLLTYPSELHNIGVHDICEDGTSPPKNRNPPPRPARQCPTTLLTWPRSLSCDTIVALLLLRPRTPAIEGGGCKSPFSWSYPQLQGKRNQRKERLGICFKKQGHCVSLAKPIIQLPKKPIPPRNHSSFDKSSIFCFWKLSLWTLISPLIYFFIHFLLMFFKKRRLLF